MKVENFDPSANVLVARREKSNINIEFDLKKVKVEFDFNVIVLVARRDVSNVKIEENLNKIRK
jgi:hypothetical protein